MRGRNGNPEIASTNAVLGWGSVASRWFTSGWQGGRREKKPGDDVKGNQGPRGSICQRLILVPNHHLGMDDLARCWSCGSDPTDFASLPALNTSSSSFSPTNEIHPPGLSEAVLRAEARLAEVQRRARSVRTVLESLAAEEATVAEYLHGLKRPRPFILSLPAEVTIEIFRLVPSTPVNILRPGKRIVPLVFGQVCRAWRRISHSASELWQNLEIRLDGPLPKSPSWRRSLTRMLDSWIDSSQPHPISLALIQPASNFTLFPQTTLIDVFARASPRVQNLELAYLSQQTMLEMLRRTKLWLPLLQKVLIRVRHNSNAPIVIWLSNLETAPSLRTVGVEGNFHIPVMPAITGSITTLIMGPLTHNSALEILSFTKLVTDATLTFDYRIQIPAPDPHRPRLGHVVLPNLRRLTLRAEARFTTSRFLAFITAPHLEYLSVHVDTAYFDPDDITLFIARSDSGVALTRFALHVQEEWLTIPTRHLTTLFSAMPGLRELEYAASDATSLVNLLRWPVTRSPTLLPRLRQLRLAPRRLLIHYGPILGFLEARSRPRNGPQGEAVDVLAAFRLALEEGVDDPMRDQSFARRVSGLQAGGMEIVIDRVVG
ncbi:F-box domain-containing protein [Mycena chlorophos]|uniref:F-box domain-containing protein n=1 Tax=Mycena chlorophos TaxID=658473 RepID=A0A8H6SKQ1_MYCCL|nr:F-box domain-containing protein [Mycena chlorophos]